MVNVGDAIDAVDAVDNAVVDDFGLSAKNTMAMPMTTAKMTIEVIKVTPINRSLLEPSKVQKSVSGIRCRGQRLGCVNSPTLLHYTTYRYLE